MPPDRLARRAVTVLLGAALLAMCAASAAAAEAPHNLILIVPDGLRAELVDDAHAPALAALGREGVRMVNSHSLFPTLTMANASALSTGHGLGDTGVRANSLYTGTPIVGTPVPFIETDLALAELDALYGRDLLHEPTLLAAARRAGYDTAAVGKLGPALLHDHTERSGKATFIFDDATGQEPPAGVPLAPEVIARMVAAGLPLVAPGRGPNGSSGNDERPGTLTPNGLQQAWFHNVITQVLLPLFKEHGEHLAGAKPRPFVLVFWSRDPDGTQHNHGDGPGKLVPGINGPTSLAAVRNVDHGVAAIRAALESLGLAATTNIVVSADHGFSTIVRDSGDPALDTPADAASRRVHKPGFLAADLAASLGLNLFDPDAGNQPARGGTHRGNAMLSREAALPLVGGVPAPEVAVAANGGVDLVYVTGEGKARRATVERMVEGLFQRDYVSGVFVDDELGDIAGTLKLSDVGLAGAAVLPRPTVVVAFRSYRVRGCASERAELCAAAIADTALRQGQGAHGTLSRADTHNFMAAVGPDFGHGEITAPASNADVARTIAHVLRLDLEAGRHGTLVGRVLDEALKGGAPAGTPEPGTVRCRTPRHGLCTTLDVQQYRGLRYLDAGGFPGRTLGLRP